MLSHVTKPLFEFQRFLKNMVTEHQAHLIVSNIYRNSTQQTGWVEDISKILFKYFRPVGLVGFSKTGKASYLVSSLQVCTV